MRVDPYYADDQITLWHGDALETLRGLPDESVNCCVTSPPYYGLRDYGEPGQYGLESSPAEYVETMRAVFGEVRRVLAADGTLWLNLGDSYATTLIHSDNRHNANRAGTSNAKARAADAAIHTRYRAIDRPLKNLLGIPWRVAFALQDDDSSDVYELMTDAPEAIYSETCRIRTQLPGANTTASTPSVGAKRTPSNTQPDARHGTQPTETSSAPTAESTTSSTASKRSSDRSEATPSDIDGSGSRHSSTTADNSHSVPAAENGTSHSSPSTTSTEEAESTDDNFAQSTSPSGNTSAESPTRPASASSATTATQRAATTDRARTRMRLLKSQIPPDLLPFFRLVQQDRWILRNCIVWDKPNAMPESVTDRLSTTYEPVFMFARSPRYWFDLDAVREPYADSTVAHAPRREFNRKDATAAYFGNPQGGLDRQPHYDQERAGRNPGDVWSMPTQPFPGAHFAVMPRALAERCILAGCRPGGVVLDPFAGSGTTGMVALKHGRRFVGIDLSATYLDLALRTRLAQIALIDEAEVPECA